MSNLKAQSGQSSSPPHPYISVPSALTSTPATFLDCSWYLPTANRDGAEEYLAGPRIAGAKFFDMNLITLPAFANPKGLPHQRPETSAFSLALEKLNLTADSSIILYGGKGCFAVPRSYYLFRSFGVSNVRILEGGLTAWTEGGGELERGCGKLHFPDVTDAIQSLPPVPQTNEAQLSASPEGEHSFVDMDAVNAQSTSPRDDTKIIDARSDARFYNREGAWEREGVRKGHMPNSINLPFDVLLNDSEKQIFKLPSLIKDEFTKIGVYTSNDEEELILTCGTGVTACNLAVGLEMAGKNMAKVS